MEAQRELEIDAERRHQVGQQAHQTAMQEVFALAALRGGGEGVRGDDLQVGESVAAKHQPAGDGRMIGRQHPPQGPVGERLVMHMERNYYDNTHHAMDRAADRMEYFNTGLAHFLYSSGKATSISGSTKSFAGSITILQGNISLLFS